MHYYWKSSESLVGQQMTDRHKRKALAVLRQSFTACINFNYFPPFILLRLSCHTFVL
jgi:hypothetical protein